YRHELPGIEAVVRKLGIPYRVLGNAVDAQTWNDGRLKVLLAHPASCAYGLNLQQGGRHVIWYTLTWSLELYQQTNARLWRQGQDADTVVLHHIITAGTIDEQIMAALQRKDRTQAALIDAVKAQLGV
ncbi:MAG: DEAD/DEAH box helicase, partial [Clostridia bacterium]|nr:DEAD/DEAH box helicase [Clostridia bacterium]